MGELGKLWGKGLIGGLGGSGGDWVFCAIEVGLGAVSGRGGISVPVGGRMYDRR